jgi:enoyl-CoA hydratase/carnithine racemase
MQILTARHGPHVAVVTVDNQAKLNAMTRAMLGELAAAWDRLEADDGVRCIVLTGAGGRAFSAGADLGGDLTVSLEMARTLNRALLKTHAFRKPIVAAVNGVCAGGGVELLLSTDLRAAAPHARFGLPEVKWSIYPFGGGTVKLNRQIGHVHAMDLLLTGRMIEAEEAARIGLINRVVAADGLMPWALATAEAIAANSPSAVQAVKSQVSAAEAEFAASQEAREQALGDAVRAGPDFAEGVAAFAEKRKPDYR